MLRELLSTFVESIRNRFYLPESSSLATITIHKVILIKGEENINKQKLINQQIIST